MTPEQAINLNGGDKVWMPDVLSGTLDFSLFDNLTMDRNGVIKIYTIDWEPLKSTELYTTENEALNVMLEWHKEQIDKHKKALAELEQKLKICQKIGTSEGERCNRNGCDGVMEVKQPKDDECRCNDNPPCKACATTPIYCPECEEEVPNGQ